MTILRVPGEALAEGSRLLPKETTKYLIDVRRLEAGARFVLFDPEARIECDATLERAGKDASARLGPPRPSTALPLREATIIQCVGKADKLDSVVRDATELGATAILPAISERSVAKRESESAMLRLKRVAVEAARQCGRGDVPRLAAPRPLASILAEVDAEVRIVLHPSGDAPIGELLARPKASWAFLVGPEGGLSEAETAVAENHGFHRARLGRFTLRTETVAAAVLGALAAFAERSGGESL
jgi:16S rRNA (uracil1498-N3)-methyltransferase